MKDAWRQAKWFKALMLIYGCSRVMMEGEKAMAIESFVVKLMKICYT